jgi:hypothetical protein
MIAGMNGTAYGATFAIFPVLAFDNFIGDAMSGELRHKVSLDGGVVMVRKHYRFLHLVGAYARFA